jgi:hypothetical protein
VLPAAHSVVGKKPMTTDAARTLPARGHDHPSSRRKAARLRAYLDYMRGGSVLLSRHGLVLESAEVVYFGGAEKWGFPVLISYGYFKKEMQIKTIFVSCGESLIPMQG